MIGSPGSGKTMLARRLPTILPPLTREEALETTKIHLRGRLKGPCGRVDDAAPLPGPAPPHLAGGP